MSDTKKNHIAISSFPVTLRNTTKNKRVVGNLWFHPNDELDISKRTYLNSKDYIDYSLENGFLEIVTEKQETDEPSEPADEQEDVIAEGDNRSIVDKFADKEVHWTVVRKYVNEIEDLRKLESLMLDAKFHKIADDSVITRSINDRISALLSKKG